MSQCHLQLRSFCYNPHYYHQIPPTNMLYSHFKSCSQLFTRNHPLQPLLPSGLQDPTPSNTHSFQNAKLMAAGNLALHPVQLPPSVLCSYTCIQFSAPYCTYITSSSSRSSSSMARCALGMRSVPKHCFG